MEAVSAACTTAVKPHPVRPAPPPLPAPLAWRLEWVKRAGAATEHWTAGLGILVTPPAGEPQPLPLFLRGAIEQLAAQLSAPSQQWREVGAVSRSLNSLLHAAQRVVDQPSAMPDHLPAVCAHAMLWGNFLDVCVALVELALTGRGGLLSVDAHTLAILTPRLHSQPRAAIPDAGPAVDFYALEASDDPNRAWQIQSEDGGLAPSVLWGLMNAFNCQFPGPASTGKEKMRGWCSGITRRFLTALQRESVTAEEFSSFVSSR